MQVRLNPARRSHERSETDGAHGGPDALPSCGVGVALALSLVALSLVAASLVARDRYLTLTSRMAKQWHFALAHVQPVFIHTMRELRTRTYYLVAFRPTVMGPGERGGR